MRWLFFLLLPACPPGEKPDDSAAVTSWYFTCGDPVCGGYSGPFDGVPLCTDETAGAACDSPDATCDPQDSCNALLVCASEDPTQQTGGCPISRARHKRDIVYLDPSDVSGVAAQAKAIRLARWSYRWDHEGAPPHLGFLIDDIEGSPAVAADGEHVDLYGYTSLVLALAQEQQRTIEAQAAKLAEQDKKLAEQETRLRAIEAKLGRM